jgi:Secretion system C-terminal sorting domain
MSILTEIGDEYINSLDFDTADRLFIGGRTSSSTGFPSVVPAGAYTQAYAGAGDAFVTRFTPSDVIDWSTRYGGSGDDYVQSLKTDKYNNAFITGVTASGTGSFPTTNPAGSGDFYDNTLNGFNDAFIVKFSFGGAVQWATYIGGDSLESAGKNSLAFNNANDIYIGGHTRSSNFPMKNSSGFFDNSFTGTDGFLMRFDGVTYDTLLSTYISGNSYPTNINVSAISINQQDEVYIGGITEDTIFPVFQQGGFFYQDSLSGAFGNTDGFLMTFDQWDNEILGTYFGGYGLGYQEQINDMVIFKDFLYAVGQTNVIDTNSVRAFPLLDPGLTAYYDSTYNGDLYDGFVSMFCIVNVTGIQESNAPSDNGSFFVYPNPATEELNIKLNKALEKDATIELYSIEGKLVYSYMLLKHTESMNIDVSNISTGLYFLRIRNTEFNSTIKFSKN